MTDKSVVEQIKHYQRDIIKCPENAKRMIRCVERLMVLPVTIAHLQETGVGRSVNELRKCGGEVGAAANALVCKWKSMVQAEEDSDVESEVEDDVPKETLQVSSPDIRSSPSIINDSVNKHKKIQDSEEYRKPKTDHSVKKRESSHSENKVKSSEKMKTHSDKHDNKSHRSKSSKLEHESESDSKHSSSHRSKSDHISRPNHKSYSSHRSESECNGDTRTERPSSKSKSEENRLSKSSSSESRNQHVKQNSYKDKRRKEDSPVRRDKENRRREESSHSSVSSSSSKKYEVRKIESESSDDDNVYKPRNKKRKKSESEEDRKYETRSESEEDVKQNEKNSGRSKYKDVKQIKHESSENSDAGNSEEDDSRHSSMHSYTQNLSENEEETSNRSSPNNISDNEDESDSRRSSSRDDENEDSDSDKACDSDEKYIPPERDVYVPTKIKREKDSPPRHKSSSDKIKLSHSKTSHTSSHKSSIGNHRSSHSSESRSTNGKVSSNKKDGFDNIKIKKEKEESDDSKERKNEKTRSSDKKSHKSSNSHSDSSNKGTNSNKSEKKVKIKVEKQDDGSIDCVSGASFADALMGLSGTQKKSSTMKRKATPSTPEKPTRSAEKSSDGKSKTSNKSEPRIPSASSSKKTGFQEPELLSKSIKLEPLDVDLKSTLPEISPHYKPLPHYSPPDSPAGKRSKMLSQEEALSSIMSTKNQRTKVYSGNKSGYLKVPSLFDLCIQVLRDNIEALEYTGGVPYDLLKPVLDRATASQLFQLEHYNPYLVEDTDGLWKFHCNKDFRGKGPDEFETWRELYVRLLDERERKLEALKANISQSMAKNTPVRQTKLAYVDSVVKPPRNIAKKQMKFGTGKAVKHDLISKAMVGAASSSPAPAAVSVPAPPASARSSQSNSFPIPGFLKKKKAPLMQKTLQLMKGNRFKR